MRFSPIHSGILRGDIPLVVMHFDINKTIIISDPASGVTADQMLNSILSECIWGTLKRKSNIQQNKLISDSIGCVDGEKSDDVKLSKSTKTEAEGGIRSVRENVSQKVQTKNVPSSTPISVESLNEDVDRTIGGIDECNEVVDEYGWSLDDWSICHPHPSPSQPEENSITFGEFIENYNFKTKMTKKEIKYNKNRFTEKGMAGESVINHFKILQDHLKFPKNEFLQNYLNENSAKLSGNEIIFNEDKGELRVGKNEIKMKRDDKCGDKNMFTRDEKEENEITINLPNTENTNKKESTTIIETIFLSGYYHIIPSFFKLVSYFHVNNIDFRIIFRTFGCDIEKVKNEFNLYCEGKHPLFPVNEVLNKVNFEKSINHKNENLSEDNNEHEVDNEKKDKSKNESEESSRGVEEDVLNHSTAPQNQTLLPPPPLPPLQGMQALQGIPDYTVKIIRMDGSHGIGVDRRLSSPYYSRMIKRSSEGSEGTRLVRTDTQGVSTV